MSSDPNWPRWIFASVSKHFAEVATAADIPLFIEGQHRATRKLKDFFELRLDGPTLREVSKGCWILRCEINILVQSVMDDKNYHRIHQNVGIAAAGFSSAINVLRLGNNPQDDQTFVGCLQLIQNRETRDYIEVNHFGQVDVKTLLQQASVEGHYKMVLDKTTS